jgi:hypothetical protein
MAPKVPRKVPAKREDNECSKVVTVPQYNGTCWFNALLMALFFSQYSRALFMHKKSEWSSTLSPKLHEIFYNILRRRYKSVYSMKEYAYMYFQVITPEVILKELNKADKDRFGFNPEERSGYFNALYLPYLLEMLGAKNLLVGDLMPSKSKGKRNLHYSHIYHGDFKYETVEKVGARKKDHRYRIKVNRDNLVKPSNTDFDVVLVSTIFANEVDPKGNLHGPNTVVKENFVLKDTIQISGQTYVLDSVLITNFNKDICSKGHDIAGLTCQGEKYIYNGWIRNTVDSSKDAESNRVLPCELMKYDWVANKENFCLNPAKCQLDPVKQTDLKRVICFNTSTGPRTYVYINKKYITASPTRSPQNTHSSIAPSPEPQPKPKKLKPKSKVCPEDKVMNPDTGRCVKKTGVLGKKIIKKLAIM